MRFEEVAHADVPLGLLLEADPSPERIAGYLSRSRCFAAKENGVMIGCAVLLNTKVDVCELMNISVVGSYRRHGVGSALLRQIIRAAHEMEMRRLEVGTGSFGYPLSFYQKAGFRVFAVDRDFFTLNYIEPVFEDGIQLKDMLRLVLEF